MIRLYDTTKGVIATDSENRSMVKPGHILILWTHHGGTYSGGYTKKPIPLDNLVEEIPEGTKIRFDLQRLMDKCPLLKRMTTISEEAYNKILIDYEHPGCIGQIARALRIRKSFDEALREYFPPEPKS